MATEKWLAGTSWTSCFGTEINSLVAGNAVLSGSAAIANGTNLDLFADVSISLGSITSGSGNPFIGIYLYPLNQDGSTYADGQFGSSAAGPPPSAYFVGAIPVKPSTTGVITGILRNIPLPPGSFKFVLYNNSGANLAASSNTVSYRTYNLQVA